MNELAREFGCDASSIHAWLNAASAQDGGAPIDKTKSLSASERQESMELRRRFKQVQQEREILAKATAWFAAKSEKTSGTSTNA